MITLKLKPLSINDAYRGRRFKSKDLEQYKSDCLWLLKGQKKYTGEIELNYKFYLKHYNRTDVGNLEKCLTDILVDSEIIPDDRYVKKITMEKFKSEENKIIIEIKPYKI